MTPEQQRLVYFAILIGIGVVLYLLFKPDPTTWHRCIAWPFRRYQTVDGKPIKGGGTLWRRRMGAGWAYKWVPETGDEYDARQW